MNFTAAIINLIDHLPWMQGAPSDGLEDQPRGDHPGTTFLDDPQRGPAAKSHGSFGIYHMMDRQRVEIFDGNREICAFIDLPSCPGATEGVEHIHAVSQRQEMRARSGTLTKIPQSLLHRRLCHRSIASLMMADQDVLWEDVKMIPDNDEFCETCQITLSRKANRGRNSLENLGKIIPGKMVMVDIIHNPAKQSITADTYFRYYLGIINVASRYFVPMGIRDKRPLTVFNAMRDWAITHGPTAGYFISSDTGVVVVHLLLQKW
jgi:hypothetical protein